MKSQIFLRQEVDGSRVPFVTPFGTFPDAFMEVQSFLVNSQAGRITFEAKIYPNVASHSLGMSVVSYKLKVDNSRVLITIKFGTNNSDELTFVQLGNLIEEFNGIQYSNDHKYNVFFPQEVITRIFSQVQSTSRVDTDGTPLPTLDNDGNVIKEIPFLIEEWDDKVYEIENGTITEVVQE